MYVISCEGLSMYKFFDYLLNNQKFREKLISLLKNVKYTEYYVFFPITSFKTSKNTDFSIKIEKAPSSLTRPNQQNDKNTFNFEQCKKPGTKAIAFLSKSKRSYLVVPCPSNSPHFNDRGHIAQFIKSANNDYIHGFLQILGRVFFDYFMKHRTTKFQLLTEGHEVYWLHAKFTFK
jgi:hypothetical protein